MSKTVFITGASSGFGEATARAFAESNDNLILTARREDRLVSLAEELSSKSKIHVAKLDVQNKDNVDQVVESLPGEFKEVDVLVNNAGLALEAKKVQDADISDWETMIDTNIKGVLYCTRAILPIMLKQDRGHIINIGSVSGTWPYTGSNVYGATKSFVAQFSKNLRADVFGSNLRITNIEPGLAETEFALVRFSGNSEKAKNVYTGTKPLSAEDIANTVHWVASCPEHVNICNVELMPVCQASTGLEVHRKPN